MWFFKSVSHFSQGPRSKNDLGSSMLVMLQLYRLSIIYSLLYLLFVDSENPVFFAICFWVNLGLSVFNSPTFGLKFCFFSCGDDFEWLHAVTSVKIEEFYFLQRNQLKKIQLKKQDYILIHILITLSKATIHYAKTNTVYWRLLRVLNKLIQILNTTVILRWVNL